MSSGLKTSDLGDLNYNFKYEFVLVQLLFNSWILQGKIWVYFLTTFISSSKSDLYSFQHQHVNVDIVHAYSLYCPDTFNMRFIGIERLEHKQIAKFAASDSLPRFNIQVGGRLWGNEIFPQQEQYMAWIRDEYDRNKKWRWNK